MRNESEQSGALFRSKGRIWTLPVRLPGNSSRVCVRCIAKSGCVMGNTAFINLNRFSVVLTSRPRWIEVNWEDTKCQSNLWENNSLAGQWCQQCDLWALQPAQGVPPVNHTSEMYSWWVTGWNKVILSFFCQRAAYVARWIVTGTDWSTEVVIFHKIWRSREIGKAQGSILRTGTAGKQKISKTGRKDGHFTHT